MYVICYIGIKIRKVENNHSNNECFPALHVSCLFVCFSTAGAGPLTLGEKMAGRGEECSKMFKVLHGLTKDYLPKTRSNIDLV